MSKDALIIDLATNTFAIFFQVETLQKSLKSSSLGSMGSSVGSIGGGGTSSSIDAANISMSPSVQNQLVQVKELEGEVDYSKIYEKLSTIRITQTFS